jgi:hypothetical protein
MPNDSPVKVQMLESVHIRTAWDGHANKSVDASTDWSKLKQCLKAKGNEPVTNFHGLKMKGSQWQIAHDRCGRYRATSSNHPIVSL